MQMLKFKDELIKKDLDKKKLSIGMISQFHKDQCYMRIGIDGKTVGTVEMKLYTDELPTTTENFRSLITGERGLGKVSGVPLCFKGSPFHRVVERFMIQGGDITRKDGTGGESVFGPEFDDEGFKFLHDKPGLLSMANRGKNTNSSQFFITLAPCPHLDGKHVVFGEIKKGMDIVNVISNLGTTTNERPRLSVIIEECGLLQVSGVHNSETREERREREKQELMKRMLTDGISQTVKAGLGKLTQQETPGGGSGEPPRKKKPLLEDVGLGSDVSSSDEEGEGE